MVNSRGVKRQSGEATNVVPIKQAKQEEVVPMVMQIIIKQEFSLIIHHIIS